MFKTKWLSLFVFCCFFSCSPRVDDEVSFVRVEPYTKIFPENTAFVPQADTVEIAAGEHAVYQFAVRSPFSMKGVRLSCAAMRNEHGEVIDSLSAKFVGYVGVGTPTDQRPHDALYSQTGLYPDPLLNVERLDIPCGQTTPIWVTVKTDAATRPGLYESTVRVNGEAGGKSFAKEQKIFLKVYPVVMEEPTFWNLNWFMDTEDKLKVFCNGRDETRYSAAYWQMLKALAVQMKEAYQNVAVIDPMEHTVFSQEGNAYSFDFSHLGEILDVFLEAGIDKMVVGRHFADRAHNYWTSAYSLYVPEMENGAIVRNLYPLEDGKVQNFYRQFIPAYMAFLKDKGVAGRYCQHIADEPIDENSASYIAIANFIKSLAPEVKVIEACQSAKLAEVVDIWIPIINSFQKDYGFFKQRQEGGDEVWFYTCCFPRGEYANRMIEWPLVKTRLIYWIAFNYGATGYLHWGFNYWTEDPYGDTTFVDNYGTTLPSGDCFVVYPDYKGGLNGSIRLEAVRQGVEDYTLLKMLERKNPELAHSLCQTVVKGWNAYNANMNHLKSVRHGILEALARS